MTEQAIHDILYRVLLSGRLAAGTKLGEHRLAEIFGVSRERIRKVLHRLGHERLLEVVRNRGAFVITPDLSEARAIYDARRILEMGIVTQLSAGMRRDDLSRLRTHLMKEDAVLAAQNRPESIRLAGEFHLLLAEMTGNALTLRYMRELVGRSAMLVTFFEPESASACSCDEHRTIFQKLAKREADAVKSMAAHLSLVETRLRPRKEDVAQASVEAILRAEVDAAPRSGESIEHWMAQ
jgi:DNA-binding GntR family transcriptional regulator